MKADRVVTAACLTAGLFLFGMQGEAHKPITSPYTYNEDVFPIVRERCGQCHVNSGVAPMSLMTHSDAVPWGESIRAELIAGHMPPWMVDSAPDRFRNVPRLTARELNILLTWASGGTPTGSIEHAPPPVEVAKEWRLGKPDLEVPLSSPFTLSEGEQERTQEFIVTTKTTEPRWVRAVDLQPGTPAIVRSAIITLKTAGAATSYQGVRPETVLAMWVPGDTPIPLGGDMGFRLPAAAEIVVKIRYKKTWQYERVAVTDRSTIGIYFSTTARTEVGAVSLTPQESARPAANGEASDRVTFSSHVQDDLQALAIYPDAALANAAVRVDAVRPDGTREELIAFHPQRDWSRRYWFAQPIVLPRGTRLDVTALFNDEATLVPPGATPPATRQDASTLGLTVNVVKK